MEVWQHGLTGKDDLSRDIVSVWDVIGYPNMEVWPAYEPGVMPIYCMSIELRS